jgi:hypothetical protein
VKEQSHKEEMSAALRGDFQRLRARGVSPSLVPHEAPEPVERPDEGPPAEEPQAVVEPPADVPPDPIPESPPATPDDEPPARRGWLSRFGGR